MTTKTASKSIAIILLGAALAAQQTHYVDAVNGLPTNGGTLPSNAFKSISQAALAATTGDTIVVLPGTYDLSIENSFPVQFGNAANQDNITVIAAEGPSQTFIDGSGTYSGIGMIRFRENARGARITGFTFQNMADSFWSCGIRLGSSSGNQFRAWDVEVDNNVFASTLHRGFVVFGAGATTQRQTTGLRIHNNLFLSMDPNRRSVAIYGDGDNHFYNNTIIHPTNTTNRAAIYLNALASHGVPSKAVIKNNIIIGGGSNSWGIEKAPAVAPFAGGALATVEYNNSFGNLVNYQGFTPSGTNLTMDPLFVSATDLRLQASSPMINMGTLNVPLIRHDLDRYPHRLGNPDMGAYESHTNSFDVTIQPKIAGSVEFEFKGAAGVGFVFLAFDESAFFLPSFGQVLIDPTILFLVGTVGAPGKLMLSVANDPTLEGIRTVFQGVHQAATNETLNVRHTYIRL